MSCKLLNANCKLISQHDQRGRLARTGAVARRHSEERVVHAAPDSPRVSGENGGMISGDVEVVEAYIGGKSRNARTPIAAERWSEGHRRERRTIPPVSVSG